MPPKAMPMAPPKEAPVAAPLPVAEYKAFIASLEVKAPKELILINPPLVPEDAFDVNIARNRGYYAFPPNGLLYLCAVAREVNPAIKLKVIDLNYELLKRAQQDGFKYRVWETILEDALKDCEAPHVAVTCMFGATKVGFLDVAKWLRAKHPHVPILSGGVQATYDWQELLDAGLCDILFRREGELQFKAFLESCYGKDSVPKGPAFRHEGRNYEMGDASGDAPVEWDIRQYYNLIEVGDYYKYGSLAAFSRYNGADKPFATVLSRRGCRARCTFCTVRDFNGFGVRARPYQSVIDEIKFLVREKGIKQIDWLDDDLLFGPEVIDLFKGLSEQVPELEWISNNGLIANAISDDVMHWMVRSGMKAFKIGIETGNDEMLHAVKKPTTKVKLRVKRMLFKKYPEVLVSANFIIGFPRETYQQMLDTYTFACELKWDWSSFYICQPLKGTEMFSVWQSMGDERCEVESYDKTLNPGRAAARGEFGYKFKPGEERKILSGREIFQLDPKVVPDSEQLKEIWFTFNMVANFLENPNFAPGGNPAKIVRWFESIAHAYPYDASMAAALARGYRLLGDEKNFQLNQTKFKTIYAESAYWRRRCVEFPELLDFAEVSSAHAQA
jgi:hypothetical protein